jgi:hypothetical protein
MAAATSNLAEASAQPSFSSWGSLNVTQETKSWRTSGAFSIKPRLFKAKKKGGLDHESCGFKQQKWGFDMI